MTKEVEDIIKNKAFSELTADERERVGELAQNEDEYSTMQWFLAATAGSFESSKITASTKMKPRVMEYLSAVGDKNGFWLNSVGVFMLPKGEPVYKKPLVQLGLAAALVVGFLFYFNQTLPEDNLALNERSEEEKLVEDSNKLLAPSTSERVIDSNQEFGMNLQENKLMSNKDADAVGENDYFGLSRLGDIEMAPPVMEGIQLDDQESIMVEDELEEVVANQFAEEKARVLDDLVDAIKKEESVIRFHKQSEVAVEKEVSTVSTSATAPGAVANGYFAASADSFSEDQEVIIPKSLHIDKTKELNQLFFIVK